MKATSLGFSYALKLSREKFLDIIRQNDSDYQKFCLIKDNILVNSNYESLNIKCSVCKNISHHSSNCPFVHFDKKEVYSKLKILQKLG